jgi:predicted O-methyltransferase YrrM
MLAAGLDHAQRTALAQRLRRAARAGARRLGYHLVKADYYSPIPDLTELPADRGQRPDPMPGVDLRLAANLRYLESIASHLAEYAPPDRSPGTASGYYRNNGMYPALDGEVLYGIVRDLKPSRIVEIGAGFSTLVIKDALAANAGEAMPCEHRVFDPYPASVLAEKVDVTPVTAQQVPTETFTELETGDILFVDTTHTVKQGNDVLRLVLEVLPELVPGVVVHIHDFFRPFAYPRFFAELGLYWQEHFLVQAFLAFNADFEVLVACHALSRLHAAELEALIPNLPRPAPGSALWLRRL